MGFISTANLSAGGIFCLTRIHWVWLSECCENVFGDNSKLLSVLPFGSGIWVSSLYQAVSPVSLVPCILIPSTSVMDFLSFSSVFRMKSLYPCFYSLPYRLTQRQPVFYHLYPEVHCSASCHPFPLSITTGILFVCHVPWLIIKCSERWHSLPKVTELVIDTPRHKIQPLYFPNLCL